MKGDEIDRAKRRRGTEPTRPQKASVDSPNDDLIDSDEMYRLLFNNMVQGVFYQKEDGSLIDANERCLEIFGLTRDEFLGRTSMNLEWKVIREDGSDLPGEEHPSMIALKTGSSQIGEIVGVFNPRTKRNVWVLVNAIPQFREDKKDPYMVFVTIEDISEKMESDRALAHSHRLLTSIIENTDECIMIADDHARPVRFNEAYARIMKESLGLEMMPGINPHRFVDDPSVVKWWDTLHERVLGGEAFRVPFEYEVGPDDRRYYDIMYYPILEEGKVTGFTEFTRDVSELKDTERSLRESEEMLRNIIENSPILFYSHGVDHVLTYLSPQSFDILGYRPEEAMVKWMELATDHPINEEGYKATMKALRTGKTQPPYEIQARRKDGTIIWAEIREIPVLRDGKTVAIVGSFTDITSRKVAEEEIRKARDFSENLIETANAIVVVLDGSGSIIMFNRFAESLTGYRKEEVIGKNWFDLFISEDEKEGLNKVFLGVVEGLGSFSDHTNQIKTKRGEVRYIRWANTVQKGPDGKVTSIISLGNDVTEQMIIEEALRESEERFRSIFEYSPVGIDLVSMDMRSLQPNSRFCEIMGYERKKLLGQNLMDLTHPDDRNELLKYLNILSEGAVFDINLEQRMRRKDGKWITCSLRATIIHDEQKRAINYLFMINDITEFKDSESRLRNAQEMYVNTLNNLMDSVTVVNKDLEFELVNDAYRNLLKEAGIDEDPIGRNIFDLQPFLPKSVKKEYDRVFEKGEIISTEEMIEVNEREFHTLTIKIPIRDEGHVDRVITVIRDVTEQRYYISELKRSEERIRNILESSPNAITITDTNGIIIECNEATLKLHGYDSKDEILGRDALEFIHPDDREIAVKNTASFLKKGRMDDIEYKLIRKDGSSFPARMSASILKDPEGVPQAYIAITADITESKTTEEQMIEERERASFYLDLLGHDIGNLHQGIFSGLQIARRTDNPEIIELGLESTEDLIKRSIKLVRNVLLLSRLKVKDPNLKRLDIKQLLTSSIKQIQGLFPDREVDIEVIGSKGRVEVIAEPILEEMFFNLLHNGIKFQQGPKPKMTINVRRTKEHVKVSFEDLGPGISDACKKDLFTRFSPRGKDSQTGIGLSLVKALAERYGAEVKAYDRIEGDHSQGARIEVLFPNPGNEKPSE